MKVICKSLALCKAETSQDASWFQTFPAFGEYAVGGIIPKAREDAVFVFDQGSADIIIAQFRKDIETHPDWPGILVDREHFSEDPDKTSDAMAWATDIRQNPDGSIWTKWTFTPKGKELWDTKTLVNRSPCFECHPNVKDIKSATRFIPTRLVSIGMTNTPHFESLSALAAAKSAAEAKNKENTNMEKITEALGLKPEATEDEVLAAIKALSDKASAAEAKATECENKANDAEKKCKECEAECRGMKADAFLETHKDQIADTAKCRELYLKDPELAEAFIAACKKPEATPSTQQQLLVGARKPAETKDETEKAKARQQKLADYKREHGCTNEVAWAACKHSNPELFAD